MNKDLIEHKDLALDIIEDTMALGFKTIGKAELQEISEGMLDVRRNMEVYGRKNSQVTSKLMTLTMLKHGPYGAIRQCDAQYKNKYDAVKENWFKSQKKNIMMDRLDYELENKGLDEFERKEKELELFQIQTELHDLKVHMEHAYREMLMYKRSKEEIMKANNIPVNFSEEDFIDAEVKENLMTAFQHALRDIQVNGMANHGTLEWLEQFGIQPAVAYAEAKEYLKGLSHKNINSIDVQGLYDWYDAMYMKYKDEYKKAMVRLGITNLVTDVVTYKE